MNSRIHKLHSGESTIHTAPHPRPWEGMTASARGPTRSIWLQTGREMQWCIGSVDYRLSEIIACRGRARASGGKIATVRYTGLPWGVGTTARLNRRRRRRRRWTTFGHSELGSLEAVDSTQSWGACLLGPGLGISSGRGAIHGYEWHGLWGG